jgi:hypothetical protein
VVGLVLEEDIQQSFDATVGGKHGVERTGHKTRARVLAVADGRASQIATTYLEYTFDVHHDGEAQPVPPVAGHTYIITADGGALQVERDDKADLTAIERAAVVQDHRNLGKPGGSEALFASRAWQLGETVALDPAQQQIFNRDPSQGTLTLKLVELTASAARFELDGQRTYNGDVNASVHAQITLDPHTGRIIARSGTVSFSGAWTGQAEERSTYREIPPAP